VSNLRSAYQLLHQGQLALARVERAGIRIDIKSYERQIEEINKKKKVLLDEFEQSDLAKKWNEAFGLKTNYLSGHQLSTILYKIYKFKPPKTTSKEQGSTDEAALRSLAITELESLIAIRKYEKIISTYLQSYLVHSSDGFIHPEFSLHTVATFRSSSSNPNLQNVPARDEEAKEICRSGLFARHDHLLLEVDFSGVEVCAAATYHKDPEMLRYLHDPKSDMHGDQAYLLFLLKRFDNIIKGSGLKGDANLYRLRQASKNGFVFPQFYGDYYKNCAVNLACNWGKLPEGSWTKDQGVPLPGNLTLGAHLIANGIDSIEKYAEHVRKVEEDFWTRRFKVYNQWRKNWHTSYQKNGFFEMKTGFRCSNIMDRNQCINYPVQGVAFHWLLKTLIETDKKMIEEHWDSRIVGEVHDSMIMDVHPDELKTVAATIRQIACVDLKKYFPWINVPINIEIKISQVNGPWSKMTPYED
jgi:DNA polymerase I-like protein with 3'-5' exonuclease and polymerase domains